MAPGDLGSLLVQVLVVTTELAARWSGLATPWLRRPRKLVGSALPTISIDDLAQLAPFGSWEGRTDLRGLSIGNAVVSPGRLVDVDLSQAQIAGVLFESPEWTNVLCNRTRLTDCRLTAPIFHRVDFEGAHLQGTFLGRAGGKYVDCTFSGVSVGKADLGSATFDGCSFIDLTGRIEPGSAAFANTRFEGLLDDFEFRNGWTVPADARRLGAPPSNTMTGVDLSGATLSYVNFVNLDLTGVVRDEARQVLWRDWERTRAHADDLAPQFKGPLGNALTAVSVFGVGQQQFILDFGFVEREFGIEAAQGVRRLLAK